MGDLALLKKHEAELQECCAWVETRLKEGHGFIFYHPCSPQSNRNQAWKDSGDAIVNEKGEICVPPLALVEIQAYAFAALQEASTLFETLGNQEKSIELKGKADRLKQEFNERFWLEHEQFYALALKENGEPIRSIASNIGHCLAFGIVPPEQCRLVVEKLMSLEMFSGWGIRTLSLKNPAFDPYSYHRGSVWTVENASIAEGMSLCGFNEYANRIITSQLSLATLFQHMRLPEVISGHERNKYQPAPGLYPYANLIQAWSVSAISQFIQTLLGIYPNAPKNTLYLDPHLPEWLNWVEIKDLRVGTSTLDIRFWRNPEGKSQWEILRCEGKITVQAKDRDINTSRLVA
jgi:glycogen debranching enzyme